MSDLAIRCEGIAKQYRIGQRESYRALRDTVTDAVTAPFRRVRAALQGGNGRPANATPTIWALEDISFEVRQGEVLGIIGRNGAGKSTLLKILSRITWPTRGSADIYGRVGSLLEVGTGFHPELTGRENVYLNGAILGMRKSEIARKFDEIVAFSEVEKFIDTPVKHFSSGMYVRLAFSVAAHLDAQVLLVDEVLAVGDLRFWTKCMNKVRSLNQQGVTILLVTHSMWQVQTACRRAICLEHGKIRYDGKPTDAIGYYEGLLKTTGQQDPASGSARDEASMASAGAESIVDFRVQPLGEWSPEGNPLSDSGMQITFSAKLQPRSVVKLLIRVTSPTGLPYFSAFSDPVRADINGSIHCESCIQKLMLMPGQYLLFAALCSVEDSRNLLAAESMAFEVEGPGYTNEALFWNQVDWKIRDAMETGGRA